MRLKTQMMIIIKFNSRLEGKRKALYLNHRSLLMLKASLHQINLLQTCQRNSITQSLNNLHASQYLQHLDHVVYSQELQLINLEGSLSSNAKRLLIKV
jgi:hypothetical protein